MQAPRDQNYIPTALGVSSVDSITTLPFTIDPLTGRLLIDLAGSVGTVTSITQGTGILLTPNPITTVGSVALSTSLQPIATLTGNSLKYLRVNAGETAVEYATVAASTPGGLNTQIQYNNSGAFGGITGATTNGTILSLTNPLIGGATITTSTLNGNTFTTGTYTLTGTAGKTLNFTNSLTLSGTDSTVMTFPTTSATLARTDAANTFTGTQTIGALVTTTINGNTFTSGTGVLTIAASKTLTANSTLTLAGVDGKTLTVSNSLSLAGTDSTVMTFPSTSATIARTDSAQTFTGTQTFSQVITTNNAITASSNAATVPITSRISTVTNSSAATLTITITTTSAVDGQMVIVRILDFSAVAQTITWVNTEDSTVTAPTTSNGSTTLPLTIGFMYNAATSKWRCVGKA